MPHSVEKRLDHPVQRMRFVVYVKRILFPIRPAIHNTDFQLGANSTGALAFLRTIGSRNGRERDDRPDCNKKHIFMTARLSWDGENHVIL